ncbi:hypothetical protein V8C35DRAFT_306410 [Trichoderma chlorosporum]
MRIAALSRLACTSPILFFLVKLPSAVDCVNTGYRSTGDRFNYSQTQLVDASRCLPRAWAHSLGPKRKRDARM